MASVVGSFSPEELQPLFNSIRESLRHYLSTGKVVYPSLSNPRMRVACGVFITLRDGKGKIRGSMGFLDTDRPLSSSAVECAIAAATSDPRYEKISYEDVSKVQIEMTLIEHIEEIDCRSGAAQYPLTAGRHGLYVEGRMNAGLLLPKEISDLKLDFNQALKRAKLKGGIPTINDTETKCYVFSARVFLQQSEGSAVSEFGSADTASGKKASRRRSVLDSIIGDIL